MLTAPGRGSAAAIAALLTLLVGATGCGGGSDATASASSPATPDAATRSCRAQWEQLGAKVGDRASATTPSTLAERWNSIEATVDYYATTGRAEDCDTTLAAQDRAITALRSFSGRLAAYDLQLRLSRVEAPATAYAARTKAPARPRGKAAAPAPRAVARALATLSRQAPLASVQQRPAWQQATATDPASRAAVAKAVKDLTFLSSESRAYRAGAAALRQIDAALKAVG